VRVQGEGLRTVELSLKDLQTRFKKHTITATLQCTGNRRDDLNSVKPVKGLEWSVGAPRRHPNRSRLYPAGINTLVPHARCIIGSAGDQGPLVRLCPAVGAAGGCGSGPGMR
jgi:hypothetical protein